ncbi:unnamed protein product [Ectocarpus sp. CCAP 1310/34]|nr:unnamed protein product [Ectocarpus sp. CCAP 1310/34]
MTWYLSPPLCFPPKAFSRNSLTTGKVRYLSGSLLFDVLWPGVSFLALITSLQTYSSISCRATSIVDCRIFKRRSVHVAALGGERGASWCLAGNTLNCWMHQSKFRSW